MNNSRRIRIGLSAVLCGALTANTFAAARKTAPVKPLDKDARGRLMLSRFTFGPAPSDLQSIRALGVDAWLEQQLAPDRISDTAFESRLDVYPSLRMTQEERLARYPEPNTIRQIAKSGRLPADPELRAIVSDQVEFYQMVQQAKAAKSGAGHGWKHGQSNHPERRATATAGRRGQPGTEHARHGEGRRGHRPRYAA